MKEPYKTSPKCPICLNENARKLLDGMVAAGVDFYAGMEFLKDKFDLEVELRKMKTHFEDHSPFALEAAKIANEVKNSEFVQSVEGQTVNEEVALDKVIAAGDQMISNWIKGGRGPKLAVTEKMWLEAVKEKGRRKVVSAMDKMREEAEKMMFSKGGGLVEVSRISRSLPES